MMPFFCSFAHANYYLMLKLGYYLFYCISLLPFWIWYGIADIIFVLAYYVFGYRKKVVLYNLNLAFPYKSVMEKRKIAKRYYRHLSDFLVETVKVFSLSKKQMRKRIYISNLEDLHTHIREHQQGAVLAMAHQFNWEWLLNIAEDMPDKVRTVVAYTPLSNPSMDVMIKQNRERFGSEMVASAHLPFYIKQVQDEGFYPFVGLVADQSPPADYKFWAPFFGIEVPVFTGVETVAKRFGLSVWFVQVQKCKRGYYEACFELLTDKPNSFTKGELTKLYLSKVEAQIRSFPDTYLWSHRRWKHAK